jgi:hypothetical protein
MREIQTNTERGTVGKKKKDRQRDPHGRKMELI